MATQTKRTRKNSKKRLALPATLVKNLEEARKNFKQAQTKSVKEMEKIYSKVIEIDFVKKVRKHEMVKRANQVRKDLTKEMEKRANQISKDFESKVKVARNYFPVPTRAEVQALSRKVNELSKRVEQLTQKRSPAR